MLPGNLFSQELVGDTLWVDFGNTRSDGSFTLEAANDLRKVPPHFLSVFEKRKALFFPVDQMVQTRDSLTGYFIRRFRSDSTGIPRFGVNIHHFEVDPYESLFHRQLILSATLGITVWDETLTPRFLGTFYYEGSHVGKRKDSITVAYETLFENWAQRFERDVLSVGRGMDTLLPGSFYHFRRGKQAIEKNFYTSVDFFFGLQHWGVDGELWFSRPEASRIFNRGSGLIRYVNRPTVHSIAVGSNIRRWNYRISPDFLFTNKMALLLGVNNWKDMQTSGHALEEIFCINASMTQQILYNRFDRTGLVFGLGIMEDLNYVIHHPLMFHLGISFHCAWKL